jgi:hypothetical protein
MLLLAIMQGSVTDKANDKAAIIAIDAVIK